MSDVIQHVTYTCVGCGATDSAHEPTPPHALNCWRCGMGRNIPVEQMVQRGVGMLPDQIAAAAVSARRQSAR